MLDHMIYPMAAMVAVTAAVLVRMFTTRVGAVRDGNVKATYYKTYQGENTEPRGVAQSSRHFTNLFEAPVLFYAACLAAMATGQMGRTLVLLAWVFVALRVVHAIVHLGSNRIPPRIAAYGAGWLVILALWALLVIGVAAR